MSVLHRKIGLLLVMLGIFAVAMVPAVLESEGPLAKAKQAKPSAAPTGYEGAMHLYEQQQYQQCLQLIKKSPDRQLVHYRMLEGNCEFALDNIHRALVIYEALGATADEYIEPVLGQAKCHYALNSFDKSLQQYELVLQRQPANVVAARGKGACLIYLRQDQAALREYERTKDAPFTADELDLWLHVLVQAERWDEAARYCARNVVPPTDGAILPQRTLSPSSREHGQKQFAQMIEDRPQLKDGNLKTILEEWCIAAFAGGLTGRKTYWSDDRNMIPREACSAVFVDDYDRWNLTIHDFDTLHSILTKSIPHPSGHDVTEFSWAVVVFEQFNARIIPEVAEFTQLARNGTIGKAEFCFRLAKAEHGTFLLTRELYLKKVWQAPNVKTTKPQLWFVGQPTAFDAWHHMHKDSEFPWKTYGNIYDNLERAQEVRH